VAERKLLNKELSPIRYEMGKKERTAGLLGSCEYCGRYTRTPILSDSSTPSCFVSDCHTLIMTLCTRPNNAALPDRPAASLPLS
jgi:hypothetical protein